MIRPSDRDMSRTTRDGPRLDQAIVAARQRVIRRHRRLGVPLAVWKDGQVVVLPADSKELAGLAETDVSSEA